MIKLYHVPKHEKANIENITKANMKTENKFRGLRTDGKGWVYGYLIYNKIASSIDDFDESQSYSFLDTFTFDELAPDLEVISRVYARANISLTEDERRVLLNYDKLGGDIGNTILVPSGLMKLEDLISNEFDGVEPSEEL